MPSNRWESKENYVKSKIRAMGQKNDGSLFLVAINNKKFIPAYDF